MLTGMGWEASWRGPLCTLRCHVSAPGQCHDLCPLLGWPSSLAGSQLPWEGLEADGLQLPRVACHIAKSFSGETCDPHVGKNDFFS